MAEEPEPSQGWWRFSPTSLYPQAVALSLGLRWTLLLGALVWVSVARERPVAAVSVLALVALYNVLLSWLHRRVLHPPLVLVAVLDIAALAVLVTLGGGPSARVLSLGLLFVLVLTLAYGGRGALAACVGVLVGFVVPWRIAEAATGTVAEWTAAGASLVVSAVALGYVVRRHEELHGRLARVTIHDRVTGLYNRAHFTEALDQLHRLSVRGGWPYALLLVDVDGLEEVNRTRGRPAGDRLLRLVGREIRGGVRGTDLVARIGEDEFAVVLPEADLPRAEHVAEKVRRRIAGLGEGLSVTIGVAEAASARMDAAPEIVEAAYRALASAKAQGGDRIATEGQGSRSEGRGGP